MKLMGSIENKHENKQEKTSNLVVGDKTNAAKESVQQILTNKKPYEKIEVPVGPKSSESMRINWLFYNIGYEGLWYVIRDAVRNKSDDEGFWKNFDLETIKKIGEVYDENLFIREGGFHTQEMRLFLTRHSIYNPDCEITSIHQKRKANDAEPSNLAPYKTWNYSPLIADKY